MHHRTYVIILAWMGLAAVAPAQEAKPAATTSPLKSLVVRSRAPLGMEVLFGGRRVAVDDSGRFVAAGSVDSATFASGSVPLCLRQAGAEDLCVEVAPKGFDTIDLAPLKVESVPVMESKSDSAGIDTTLPTPVVAPVSSGVVLLKETSAGGTVTVSGRRKPRTGGQERVSVQSILRRPALGEPDVIRAVQALPGVVQSSDFSTKIYVRGSASDQNLILWDGAPVYSPAHFMGLFSTFLTDATGNVEFCKGGFDPRYGNRLSSVLRVDPRIGGSGFGDSLRWLEGKIDGWTRRDSTDSADKFRLHGNLRLTTASGSLALEGRKSDWYWSVAARRTWIDQALDIARDLDLMTFQLDYVFHDIQGNLTRTWGRDTARISFYEGRDRLALGPMSFEWGNFVVPVVVHKTLPEDFWWRPSASLSRFDQVVGIEGIRFTENSFDSWKLGEEAGWLPKGPVSVLAGHEHEHQRFVYVDKDLARSDDRGDTSSAWLHAGWVQGSWEHSAGWGVRGGSRGSWYEGIDATEIEPRITGWWKPSPNWRLELHEGRYAQFLTSLHDINGEEMTDIWYAYQRPMRASTQWLSALSAERSRIPGGFTARAEAYYKDISRLPQMVMGDPDKNPNPVRPDGNKVTRSIADFDGWSMGAEFTLSRDVGAVSGTASYGWSKSVLAQTASPVAPGMAPLAPFTPAWDQRHTFKADLSANWIGEPKNAFWAASRKGRFLRSSLSLQYRSGHPSTEPAGYWDMHEPMQGADGWQSAHDGVLNPPNNTLVQAGAFNQSNVDDYFRLDVTPFDFGREGAWRLYWSVLNATDHENVFQTSWETDGPVPRRDISYQFPRLAIFVGWEKEF
ncbi:MAG: TonB-dependent receptor plug domain-containing protein [Fibrobacterota bacterium]|nr:MAG: TonB-dependent receptor plug domain-containing protein [Fibrobacterota bacterium]